MYMRLIYVHVNYLPGLTSTTLDVDSHYAAAAEAKNANATVQ